MTKHEIDALDLTFFAKIFQARIQSTCGRIPRETPKQIYNRIKG
jgi:hypothetical protein